MTARTVLKLALPKGRLLEPSLALLRSIGALVSEPATTRKLLVPSSDGTLSVLFVKPADVPVYVESGAAGPLPADTVFVRALRGEFDAVLTPYHDVGMTAVKVAGFGKGVNITLGLPFPRTAPDHGTAFDIAGKDVADPSSMRAALELAVELARRTVVPRSNATS